MQVGENKGANLQDSCTPLHVVVGLGDEVSVCFLTQRARRKAAGEGWREWNREFTTDDNTYLSYFVKSFSSTSIIAEGASFEQKWRKRKKTKGQSSQGWVEGCEPS